MLSPVLEREYSHSPSSYNGPCHHPPTPKQTRRYMLPSFANSPQSNRGARRACESHHCAPHACRRVHGRLKIPSGRPGHTTPYHLAHRPTSPLRSAFFLRRCRPHLLRPPKRRTSRGLTQTRGSARSCAPYLRAQAEVGAGAASVQAASARAARHSPRTQRDWIRAQA